MTNLTEALAKTSPAAQKIILDKINECARRIEEIDRILVESSNVKFMTAENLRALFDELVSSLAEDPEPRYQDKPAIWRVFFIAEQLFSFSIR